MYKKVILVLMSLALACLFSCKLGTCTASGSCTDEVYEAADNAFTMDDCQSIVLESDGYYCEVRWDGILSGLF